METTDKSRELGATGEISKSGSADAVRDKQGNVRYQCVEPGCGRLFTRRSNLKVHRRMHTKEEPYVCTYPGCNKQYKWRSCLASHRLVHEKQDAGGGVVPQQMVSVVQPLPPPPPPQTLQPPLLPSSVSSLSSKHHSPEVGPSQQSPPQNPTKSSPRYAELMALSRIAPAILYPEMGATYLSEQNEQ